MLMSVSGMCLFYTKNPEKENRTSTTIIAARTGSQKDSQSITSQTWARERHQTLSAVHYCSRLQWIYTAPISVTINTNLQLKNREGNSDPFVKLLNSPTLVNPLNHRPLGSNHWTLIKVCLYVSTAGKTLAVVGSSILWCYAMDAAYTVAQGRCCCSSPALSAEGSDALLLWTPQASWIGK